MKTVPDHNLKRLEYLSHFLYELRVSEGLSQEELSRIVNLHRNTIIRAESGKNLTVMSLFELADAFQITPGELFQDIE